MNIIELINLIDDSNREACLKLFNDNKDRFIESPGSLIKHQAWKGGYIDHLEEVMNFGIDLYNLMIKERILEFSISDFILVLFLHDLEKPFRYIEPKINLNSDIKKEVFIINKIQEYGIVLTEDHLNALKYIHGEGNDYNRTDRIQKPLAAFVHICDVVSARIWFDYPRKDLI